MIVFTYLTIAVLNVGHIPAGAQMHSAQSSSPPVPAAAAPAAQTAPVNAATPAATPAATTAPAATVPSQTKPAAQNSTGAAAASQTFATDTPPSLQLTHHRLLPPPSTATRQPDLFTAPTVYPKRGNFLFEGDIDLRYRTQTTSFTSMENTVGSYIPASRLTADYVRANTDTGLEQGGVRVQLLLENNNDGTALNRLRASELYGFYRFPFPGVSATIRGGQFVLPFGLAAVYDTPLQPIQPLYEQSVGLRVDTGAMLEGEYGLYHYAGSITTGDGPDRRYTNQGHVVAFRLARAVETPLGRFQVGGSLLSGTLPVTTFNYLLPPSGLVSTHDYIDKSRFAGDGEYFLGKFVARGEAVFGADAQDAVWGYFAEVNYQFEPRVQVVAYSKAWNFPVKPQALTDLGTGLNFDIGYGLVLRTLFEYERDVPPTPGEPPTIIRRITLQTRLTF